MEFFHVQEALLEEHCLVWKKSHMTTKLDAMCLNWKHHEEWVLKPIKITSRKRKVVKQAECEDKPRQVQAKSVKRKLPLPQRGSQYKGSHLTPFLPHRVQSHWGLPAIIPSPCSAPDISIPFDSATDVAVSLLHIRCHSSSLLGFGCHSVSLFCLRCHSSFLLGCCNHFWLCLRHQYNNNSPSAS